MIETSRHDTIFDPHKFNTPIHVIGLGATGSKIAIELAKLGIRGELIHLWDFDKVESHNLSNQAFGLKHIGQYKADAVAEIIMDATGESVNSNVEEVKDQKLEGYVFLLTDTMSSRREIFENCIELNPKVKQVIETRMGVDSCRIYCFKPVSSVECEKWVGTLCGDDVAEVSACGASISVGPTSSFICGSAVWQFIRSAVFDKTKDEEEQRIKYPEFEVMMWTNPFTLMSQH